MVSKMFMVVCLQLAVLNIAWCQCMNRMLPTCGCGALPAAEMLQGAAPMLLAGPHAQAMALETLMPGPLTVPAATTIIQDSTVSNNLANALQLLVVSNLLSSTLPSCNGELVLPSAPCGCSGLGGYKYVY